ncbi:hypothetical protein SGQ44_07750 [Flavobacterium sp. Fl-77]|uniref:DUF4149 domain-containing protein n=1 Tax=Flavobacterium flavipigmentatum TaxID=2893884 RepID=A0AAJ2SEN5_9FLAO|nr:MULTISPECIES: hypothetical protein [unclassified Flavobacterium]MDX6182442.1 hypothetical protein [Flavobacterium sp. Fl-33]MDX6185645.1 hypothetical protein [Flavobacterium sp. Fl-77]UFH38830.1 hypothetical protein LNP22_00800 [Flavobacterium sp. F-70]
MLSIRKIAITAISFTWCGLIIGISFIESWLKFRAPNVTLSIGLGIGKLVFGVLNKIEILLLFTIIIISFNIMSQILKINKLLFLIVIIALVLQTFWILPILDFRAKSIIEGLKPIPSFFHLYFILLELIKLVALFTFGLLINKSINKKI